MPPVQQTQRFFHPQARRAEHPLARNLTFNPPKRHINLPNQGASQSKEQSLSKHSYRVCLATGGCYHNGRASSLQCFLRGPSFRRSAQSLQAPTREYTRTRGLSLTLAIVSVLRGRYITPVFVPVSVLFSKQQSTINCLYRLPLCVQTLPTVPRDCAG